MANHNCKCGDNCTCDPCNCDKIEEFDNIPPVTVIGHKGGFTGGWAHWDLSGHGDNGWQGVPYAYPPKPKCKKRSNQIRPGLPTLKLTAQDIQDIIKVTSTEVDLRGGDVARQTAGVVDTILNRASLKKYGGNIRNVINENSQFSKISGAPGAYGSVQAVPDKVINAQVKAEVLNHLQNRANGTESTVGGAYALPESQGFRKKITEYLGKRRSGEHQKKRPGIRQTAVRPLSRHAAERKTGRKIQRQYSCIIF